jgi:hypothetical protein
MKWKFSLIIFASLLIVSLFSCNQKTDERNAIIKLLEKESATWRAGDFAGHAACWHIQPYSRILISTAEGAVIDLAPDIMIKPSAHIGHGGVSVNTNYKMSINGNNAWVSHNEESTSKDGKKSYSYEIRILEKIDDQWKLVAQSIHVYKPS